MIITTTATNLLILSINFVTSILAARLLGADGRGALALVLLYPQTIAVLGLLGTDRSVSIVGGKNKLNNLMASTISLTLLISVPVMSIIFFVITMQIADATLARLSWLYTFYVPPLYFFMLSTAWFNGTGHFFEYNVSRFSYYGSNIILILCFWAANMPLLDSFVVANLSSVYVSMLVSWGLLLKVQPIKKINLFKDVLNDCFAIATKASIFVLPAILAVISAKLDQIILINLIDVNLIGIFVVYVAFSRLIGPIANAVNVNVFHASIVHTHKLELDRTIRISIFTYFIFLVLMGLTGSIVINFLYGDAYTEYLGSARLLLFSSFFYFSSQLFNEIMKGKSKVNQDVISHILYIFLIIPLGYFLVPRWSILGMAIAMVIADAARFLYLLAVICQELENNARRLLLINKNDLIWGLNTAKNEVKF